MVWVMKGVPTHLRLQWTRWWFQRCLIFTPYLGRWSNLPIFQMGWFNHQLVKLRYQVVQDPVSPNILLVPKNGNQAVWIRLMYGENPPKLVLGFLNQQYPKVGTAFPIGWSWMKCVELQPDVLQKYPIIFFELIRGILHETSLFFFARKITPAK